MLIRDKLFELRDESYAQFQAKLTPTVSPELFIGVRVPLLRKFAKQCEKEMDVDDFLQELPHKYYDENLLHAILLANRKDFASCMEMVEAFVPYIDNWAVCDTLVPKVFAKNKPVLLQKTYEWCGSFEEYTCRFGLRMLMCFFLDEDFKPEYLKMPATINSEAYYVNMMIAWYYAEALAKHWEETIPYLENDKLGIWVHNKTIQKAIESYRITDEQKNYLRSLRRKAKKS